MVLLPQKKWLSTRHGFTLIELMLVILVVALISVYAVQLINQSLMRTQISRAANQILSIKQAATAYYISYKKWPSSLDDLVTQSYLPSNSSFCSPFGAATPTSPCGYYAQYIAPTSSPNTNFLQLNLTLPSLKLAQELIAIVPNAWISSGTTMSVAINQPVDISTEKNHGWIVSAGVVSVYYNNSGQTSANLNYNTPDAGNGTKIYLPVCPPPYEGHILFFPLVYQTDTPLASLNPWTIHMAQLMTGKGCGLGTTIEACDNNSMSLGSSIVYKLNGVDTHGNQMYASTTADDPGSAVLNSTQNHLATFMTVCLPAHDNSSMSHWATFQLNNHYQQDGQCATGASFDSWNTYNPGTFSCSVEPSTNPTVVPAGYPPVGSPYAD